MITRTFHIVYRTDFDILKIAWHKRKDWVGAIPVEGCIRRDPSESKAHRKVIKVDLRTINAFRRPSKSDKIDPRRDPGTHAIAHSEAGEGIDNCPTR